MHITSYPSTSDGTAPKAQNTAYVWMIALIAAMGGLLFGYDWVVIGGARQFYEAYFQLTSAQLIGWANSCALVGCFAGSLLAGYAGERFGRRRVLFLSAVLFAVSSGLTGWSYSFSAFVFWRIVGGIAIGLSSNISPLYIAEISPASVRGRLVSLNQFAIVVGILLAQIANWQIARPIPEHIAALDFLHTWNAQYGWRWMFCAVVAPAIVFTVSSLFIPESPRWLLSKGKDDAASEVLTRVGGHFYAVAEVANIRKTLLIEAQSQASWKDLWLPGIRRVLLIGVTLAVLQQWTGINILFNYAAEVYRSAGYGENDILLNIVITGAINLIFTIIAMLIVDRVGRRPMMLFGCLGIGVSHLLSGLAYRANWHGSAVLLLTLGAIACYALTLAPVTWVLIAEIFPNRVRSQAVSVSVSALWVASFILTYTFPAIDKALGSSGTFLGYGAICMLGALFVYAYVPETKGRTLEEIEARVLFPGR
ncbi:sugar porter (SP) family MFS transporter [Silvibacterium bohemicum]|uniref:Sugar porter (SP) family MFS transporter n=1 Tax=Silvibacterium bohemicum TaxID=1577686 RepID=A0A841JSX7_9BACT|nr:sugar porter family MFS transporter [Silvibacterium bohemicum]MBB6144260.1 sugar porter (SP) family MFS transporter [Silvibacterium bohemicum]